MRKNTDGAKSGNIINKVLTSDNDSIKKTVKTSFVCYQVYPAKHTCTKTLENVSVSTYFKV